MKIVFTVIMLSILILPTESTAYIGPGAGLSAIGSLLALLAALFFTIVGFIWYPVKRILNKRKARRVNSEKQDQ